MYRIRKFVVNLKKVDIFEDTITLCLPDGATDIVKVMLSGDDIVFFGEIKDSGDYTNDLCRRIYILATDDEIPDFHSTKYIDTLIIYGKEVHIYESYKPL